MNDQVFQHFEDRTLLFGRGRSRSSTSEQKEKIELVNIQTDR